MNEVLKENDILLATILKPDISNIDLFKNDITLENTLLLSKDQYKNSPIIKNAFSKEGVFDELLFDLAYKLAAEKYSQMQEDELMRDFINELEYSKTSFFRSPEQKTYSTDYKGLTIKNPLLLAVGLEGINVKSEATKTEKEVALSHSIWDPKLQKWLNESAESRNIFLKAFGESLIYAKYTKDGYLENPITKEKDYHSAGEFITDEDGNYFTQLAGDVDLTSNVEIVKLQDTLSDEDSWWNKIDFYDSDSKEKSIPGTVMKTLAQTIPYFIPYLGPAYTTAAILVGLGENLPQIAKSFDWSPNGSAFSKSCNSVVNWFSKLSPSVSLYGLEHFWSIENIGNFTADIVGLLYLLRGVASLSKYLTKTNKYIKELEAAEGAIKTPELINKYIEAAEQLAKIQKALTLGYMSLVLAGDVYNDALNAGYSRGVAGLATLMSTAAFFGIMNYNESLNGLGTWFLDKTTGYDRDLLRSPVAKLAKNQVRESINSPELKKIIKEGGSDFGSKMRNHWLNFWSKVDDAVRIGSEGAWTSAIAEGVEEVSEEVVQDGVKGLIDGLNYLGYKSGKWGDENASFGGWSNVFSKEGLERYIETFFGGAVGGAMFDITQNKVKPFTDSLFGIKTDIPKPIEYDKIDIALLGRENTYYKEVDKAVKFIDNRELDLGNPEDAKIYKARQAIADNLKNEMKTTVDLVKSITAGANFNTVSPNFREAIQKSFKPLVTSSGAIDYIESKWKNTVGQLANVLEEIKSRENDLLNNKDKVDVELIKEIINLKKEEAKQLRLQVLGYFSGKSYIDTHDEASLLANKDLLGGLVHKMTPQEFYENFLKGESGKDYNDLVDESADPNKLSKKNVADQADAFSRELLHQFDSSNLPDLYKSLPVINKALKAMAKLIGPDITAYLSDSRKRTVVENAIRKMQQDRDLQLQQLEALDLMSLLDESELKKYEQSNEEEKKGILGKKSKELSETINEAFSIPKLVELLKNDPNAFSLADRRNIDYTNILESKGIIEFYNSITLSLKRVIKTLINSEFANVPLASLSEKNILTILDGVLGKLSSRDSYWGDLFINTDEQTTTSVIDANANLLTFKVNLNRLHDTIDSVLFIKLNDIKDFLAEDKEYISKELYDFLLELYKRLDAEFLNNFRGTDPNYDTDVLDVYLENPSKNTQKEILSSMEYADVYAFAQKLGIPFDKDTNPDKLAQEIQNRINGELKAADFINTYKDSELVENNFLAALNKVSFSIIGDPKIRTNISNLVKIWEKSLRSNGGLQIDSSLSKEAIEHLLNILNIIQTVVATMASSHSGDDKIESILERNLNFAKAMGEDGSDYYVIDEREGDLMKTIILEMGNKLSLLKQVLGNIEESLFVKFEEIRKKMLDNLFKLFRYHIARKDDPLYIKDLAEEIESEIDLNFSEEQKLQKIFKYLLAIYLKLQSDDFGGEIFKENYLSQYNSRLEAVILFLMDFYGKENGNYKDDIFFTGQSAIDANNQQNTDETNASYLLTELVGLVGLGGKYSPKIIQDSLLKSFEELGLYPRQDQIYSLLLALYGILGKPAYSYFGHILESWYNDDNSRGATKLYIENLIKILGFSGSGKTSLYSVLIRSLLNLGDTKDLPVVVSALSEYKVNSILKDLSARQLENPHYLPLYDLISNLKTRSANWRLLETKIISALVPTEVRDSIISGKLSTLQLDKDNAKYGTLLFTTQKGSNNISIKVSGTEGEYSAFDVEMIISKKLLKDDAFAGNLRFYFTDKSFESLSIQDTSLDNGLLVIDEVTNLNIFEWQALSKLAKDYNFNIVATGDSYQRGYLFTYFVDKYKKKAYIGDENILGLNTPILVSTHRALNSAVESNEKNIRKIADIALKDTQSHEGLSDYEYTKSTLKTVEDLLGGLLLEYTLDNELYGFLGGALSNSIEDLYNKIDTIKNPEAKTVLIITNSEEDKVGELYNYLIKHGFNPENLQVVSLDDVLGAEADYAIAYNIEPSNSTLADLKEIYTLVTRGRYGFIGFGENSIFKTRRITNTDKNPVVVISKNTLTDAKAKTWLDTWKRTIESIEDITPQQEPEFKIQAQSLEYDLLDNKEQEEDEEDITSKITTNISDSFAGQDWLYARRHGYMLGISLNHINYIKDKSVTTWRSSVDGTSFGYFLQLLDSEIPLIWKLDLTEISNILVKVKPKGNLGKDYIESYIIFINLLREADKNGKITGLSFLKHKAYGEGVKEDNPNISYLKYNDNYEWSTGSITTYGIPIITGGNISGHIILGRIDSNSRTESTGWYQNLEDEKPILKVRTNDQEKLDKHNSHLVSYHEKAGHKKEVASLAKTHNGIVAALTNLRDWRILSDWQHNISEEELMLERMTALELLDSGYELAEKKSFNTGKGINFTEFINWYNSYRWSDLSKDKADKFASIIGHNGKYFVIRPKGTSEKGFPILVRAVTTWENFITQGGKTNGGYIKGYVAQNIIYAAVKYGLSKNDHTLSSIKELLLDDNKKSERQSLFLEIVNSDKLKGYVTQLDLESLRNSATISGTDYSKEKNLNRFTPEAFKNTKLYEWLNKNAANFPYTNAGDNLESSYIVTRVFEQENVLIDLELLVDPKVLLEESTPQISIVEFGDGLSDAEFSTLTNFLKGVLSGDVLSLVALDLIRRRLNVANGISLLSKMSREDIQQLDDKLRRNLINVIYTLLDLPRNLINDQLKTTLQEVKTKIESDRDIKILCSI